ncbi:ion channel [Gilvimarinus sp. SDUM040013]|uniref:Ion channel n=1 Tax=Gilvimarinus gilvus TaxID=3058038 RepID=A0ABU4S0G6_9GAMM|nr:potassium channel family protein [Gilvimarinus sp. SDUM040013]MDO3384783.1 ion channel [Gilvimarinus sp. SDUM040013]MDX6850399.1 ion channel [Gilvimarinus sp. SDUM040013]
MLVNFILGLAMMAFCLFLQGALVLFALHYSVKRMHKLHSAFGAAMRVTAGMMLILIVGNVAQVVAWGTLFFGLGEFASLPEAIYHSAVNFATLGYGDIVMSEAHKLLGPLEALNGALMIGVSTAALSRAFAEVLKEHMPEARR